jgi:hypothetical protein
MQESPIFKELKENARVIYIQRIRSPNPYSKSARGSGVKLIEALIGSLIPGEGEAEGLCHVSAVGVGWGR